jgi:hypothetical protein
VVDVAVPLPDAVADRLGAALEVGMEGSAEILADELLVDEEDGNALGVITDVALSELLGEAEGEAVGLVAEWVDVAVLDDVNDPVDESDINAETVGCDDSDDETDIVAEIEGEPDDDFVAVDVPPVADEEEVIEALFDDSLVTDEEGDADGLSVATLVAEEDCDMDTVLVTVSVADGDIELIGDSDDVELELGLLDVLDDGDINAEGDKMTKFGVTVNTAEFEGDTEDEEDPVLETDGDICCTNFAEDEALALPDIDIVCEDDDVDEGTLKTNVALAETEPEIEAEGDGDAVGELVCVA